MAVNCKLLSSDTIIKMTYTHHRNEDFKKKTFIKETGKCYCTHDLNACLIVDKKNK